MSFLLDNTNNITNALHKMGQSPEINTHFEAIVSDLTAIFKKGKKLIIFGNGGSACDAAHVAEELTGQFRQKRKALPAIALTEPGHITCVANDFGYDRIFERGVEAYAKPGDMVIGLSTSGNSENVIKGIQKANELGAVTVCFLGKTGGTLKGMATHEILVPCHTADRIQEIHKIYLHSMIEGVERHLFPEQY